MNERAIGLLTTGAGIALGIILAAATGLLGDAVDALVALYRR